MAVEQKDPGSILNFYQRLLALRHKDPAFVEGKYMPLNENDAHVLTYLRSYKGRNLLVLLNMSAAAETVNLDLASKGVHAQRALPMLVSSSNSKAIGATQFGLGPFGVYIAELR